MIRSMTAYSRAGSEENEFSLSVRVKSTNHRFLDMQFRLPVGLEPLEPFLRRLVRSHVERGHVEVTVTVDRAGPGVLEINRRLLDAYVSAYRNLRGEFGFTSDPDLMALLRIPGMVGAGNGELSPETLERIQTVLDRVARETLKSLNEMRAREGEALERDLQGRLGRLRTLIEDIAKLAHGMPELFQRRLANRIRDLMREMPGAASLDAARLAQEVAILASRTDITEEVTRFRSHLDQARQLLDESSEIGKKLDFLLQEMNREANTLLSKTTDVPEVGQEIARQAIEMKAEIEKLREQAQNIE